MIWYIYIYYFERQSIMSKNKFWEITHLSWTWQLFTYMYICRLRKKCTCTPLNSTRGDIGTCRFCKKLHLVRMMFGVSLIVPNINTERLKGILWHSGHEINMRSTRSPSTTSGDRGLDKRRTAEHLRVPLLFARDNPGCNDLIYDCTKTANTMMM